jgi:hypothetical protein
MGQSYIEPSKIVTMKRASHSCRMSVHVSLHMHIHMYMHMSVHMSFHMSMQMFIHMSIPTPAELFYLRIGPILVYE